MEIMPILDQLVQANPHACTLRSAGVDIVEIKRLVGDKICLIGNVNCGLLQTGTDEEVIKSVRYALKYGMPGGGIFSPLQLYIYRDALERYELMLDIWRKGEYTNNPEKECGLAVLYPLLKSFQIKQQYEVAKILHEERVLLESTGLIGFSQKSSFS